MQTSLDRIEKMIRDGQDGPVEITAFTLKNGGTVTIEEHANGTIVIEQPMGARGRDVANSLGRTCSGSCGEVSVGPINCPTGTSPHLDFTKNPPTLKCVKGEWA